MARATKKISGSAFSSRYREILALCTLAIGLLLLLASFHIPPMTYRRTAPDSETEKWKIG